MLYKKYKSLFNAYHVNTPLRIAHFMAQAEAENNLKSTRESLYYKTIESLRNNFYTPFKNKPDEFVAKYLKDTRKCANYVYSNRNGNGNEASGDGYKFRGGGIFQNTFKNAYLQLSKDTRINFIDNPDLITVEANAVIAALWYWSKNQLNTFADNDMLDAISDTINLGRTTKAYGDANGFKHRKDALIKWKAILKEEENQ